jgi:hypothetical protein
MKFLSARHPHRALLTTVLFTTAVSLSAHAQTARQLSLSSPAAATVSISAASSSSSMDASSSFEQAALLPDAPGLALLSAAESRAAGNVADAQDHAAPAGTSTLPAASHTQKFIEPGQVAPKLTANDKVLLGLRDSVSPFSALGWFVSAGYDQVTNGSPNYGTDSGAFGQRLGAAVIRDISEEIFADSVMAPILHEDPRYYRLGPAHGFLPRVVYAATRPILTRTDSGRTTPNLSLVLGYGIGSAFTNLYYPSVNTGATQTLETLGGSIGSTALGDLVSEFYDDVFHRHHHQ